MTDSIFGAPDRGPCKWNTPGPVAQEQLSGGIHALQKARQAAAKARLVERAVSVTGNRADCANALAAMQENIVGNVYRLDRSVSGAWDLGERGSALVFGWKELQCSQLSWTCACGSQGWSRKSQPN